MKRIKHPGNFLLACVMAVVCLICLGVCLFFRMDGELLAVGFITGVWADTDFYEAFHKEPIEERVGGQGDERDVFLAMKSSRTAMGIFNKVLFLASVLSLWGFAKFDLAFLLPVGVTLSGAVLFLFLLLLCVNLYYEKRG